MTDNEAALSEQSSLFAHSTGDPAWLDRMSHWDPVARLGDTFLLNAQSTDQAAPHTRLISPEAIERVGEWLAETLHTPFEVDATQDWAMRPALGEAETRDLLGFGVHDLPGPYAQWRFSTELYALVGDTAFVLMNDQFVRYRKLDQQDLGILLSGRTAPFQELDDATTGTVLVVVAVPGRLSAFGGLRGHRRGLVAAGEAMGHLRQVWDRVGVAEQWTWEQEFFDDACCRALGLDGVERVPLALAYQREPLESEENA